MKNLTGYLKKIKRGKAAAALLMLYDLIAVNFSSLAALWLLSDCRVSAIRPHLLEAVLHYAPIQSVLCLLVFFVMRLYGSIWHLPGVKELIRTGIAVAIIAGVQVIAMPILFVGMPTSFYVFFVFFFFVLTIGVRFSYRFILLERTLLRRAGQKNDVMQIMLIGAGAAGRMVVRDAMHGRKSASVRICCIIDDDKSKWGSEIDGVPIVGGRYDIIQNVKKYRIDRILIALPSAGAQERRNILNICKETQCSLKILPDRYYSAGDKVSMHNMKDVAVEDLLGREPIVVDSESIYRYIQGKTVLVTGGGGSIGSELCRQIAKHSPKKLVIFDIYENNAYDIEQELRRDLPELDLTVLIGSVRDSRRVNSLFETYRPDVVYHAAAHKHVPLMEHSPCEAIKNNVVGTYKVAYAAVMHGCKRFVLISTDKAVNPTNIMGASKRLCEMVIQSFDDAVKNGYVKDMPVLYTHDDGGVIAGCDENGTYCTEFVAVRFGNVLGSNGSVVPLFKKQIAEGGPVTVTHPDIIRYFMTIPEAVSLVIQAGVYAEGGEIFVLDMGAPVRIDDLARNLIRLSGFTPDEDIDVVYTGLRPGEKLYEEKLMSEEGLKKTDNDRIHVGKPITFDTHLFFRQLQSLMISAYDNNADISKMVADILPTYHPAPNGAEKKDTTYEKLCAQAQTTG